MNFQLRNLFSRVFFGLLLYAAASVAYADIEQNRAEGIAWLLQNQNGDGSWGKAGAKVAATAETLEALRHSGADHGFIYSRALSWLANAKTDSVDSLSRKIIALEHAGFDTQEMGLTNELLAHRNTSYAWGAFDGYGGGFPDTALAMGALLTSGTNYSDTGNTLGFMVNSKLAGDQGWSYMGGATGAGLHQQIMPTALNISTLSEYKKLGWNIGSYITGGVNWLLNDKKKVDGSFLDDVNVNTGIIHKTALVYLALDGARGAGIEPAGTAAALTNAQAFILGQQSANGSWNGDPYQSALALRTFTLTTLLDSDGDGIPDAVEWQIDPANGNVDARDLIPGNGLSNGLAADALLAEVLVQQALPNVPTATGGTPPYAWGLASGAFPPGVTSINPDGSFVGVPSAAGIYPFALYVQDATLARTVVSAYIKVVAADDLVTDTDNDGLASSIELSNGFDPLNSTSGPLVAADDPANTLEDNSVSVLVLGNDQYENISTVSIISTTPPNKGTATISLDAKSIDYTPDNNLNGTDSFTYTISNGISSASATVTVNIASQNDNPTTVDDIATTLEGISVTINVRSNDSDVDGDTLSVTDPGTSTNGYLTTDGVEVTYTPNPGHIGTDSFIYTVHDGNGGYATATVTVTTKDASATLYDIVYDPAITAKGITPSVPVNQNIGIPDTAFSLTSKESCWQCHTSTVIQAGLTQPFEVPDQTVFLADRHHQFIGTPIAGGSEQPPYLDADSDGFDDENYSCRSCHAQTSDVNGDLVLTQDYQDCLFCHVVDGTPKTVHHDTPKAKEALCAKCHGSLVRNLDEGLPPSTEIPGIITPRGSNKLNADASTTNSAGTHPGNCDFCHNTQDGQPTGTLMPSILGNITVFPNENTHHSTGVPEIVGSSKGSPCQWCHIIEWPAWYEGDPTADKTPWQMRACQRCHDAASLHGIEVDIAGDGIVPGAEAYNSGHIGNPDNCWGCHGNDSDMIPVYTGGMPVVTATTPQLDGISAVTWKKGTAFVLDLKGNGFINQGEEYDPLTGNVAQTTFMPSVQLTDSDGNTTVLDPLPPAADFISVTVPGSLPDGSYQIQVKKDNKLSNPIGATITPPINMGRAICIAKFRIALIRGNNFGSSFLLGSDTGTHVTANGVTASVVYFWRNNMIAARFNGECPDEITVTNIFDSATVNPSIW